MISRMIFISSFYCEDLNRIFYLVATMLTYAITVFPAELKVKRDVDFKTTPLSTDPPDFSD